MSAALRLIFAFRPVANSLIAETCRGKAWYDAVTVPKSQSRSYGLSLTYWRWLRALPKVKKVFIRSGIRFDYLMEANDDFLEELCRYHVSGQLKVAPEHVAAKVTRLMGKSPKDIYPFCGCF